MSGKWLSIVMLVMLLLPGCAKKAENASSETSEHTAFVQSAEQKLAEYDARMDTLNSHLALAGDKAKAEIKQDLDSLQSDRQNVQAKLDALRSSTEGTWESAKQDFATALDSLDAKFDRARGRIH